MLKMLRRIYNQSLPLQLCRNYLTCSLLYPRDSILFSFSAKAATSIPLWAKVVIAATIVTAVVGGAVGAGVYFGVVGK